MKKVCENCFLDDAILFLDGESKEHTIVGSIEVKGIRGSDRRKYILDLMRLSPRDFNYPDETE
jgi:protein TIF31